VGDQLTETQCKECGVLIDFVERWRPGERMKPRWVVVETHPDPLAIESYVEVDKEVFVSVFRHKCLEKP
jgi:hypothetical protein